MNAELEARLASLDASHRALADLGRRLDKLESTTTAPKSQAAFDHAALDSIADTLRQHSEQMDSTLSHIDHLVQQTGRETGR